MVSTVICDRCRAAVWPAKVRRLGAAICAAPTSLVHIPGYDGDYAERYAYIDLCPACAEAFGRFMTEMRGEEENGDVE